MVMTVPFSYLLFHMMLKHIPLSLRGFLQHFRENSPCRAVFLERLEVIKSIRKWGIWYNEKRQQLDSNFIAYAKKRYC